LPEELQVLISLLNRPASCAPSGRHRTGSERAGVHQILTPDLEVRAVAHSIVEEINGFSKDSLEGMIHMHFGKLQLLRRGDFCDCAQKDELRPTHSLAGGRRRCTSTG
jgi:hypothetical protein